MKKAIGTLVLALIGFSSAALAVTDLGEAQGALKLTPDRVAVVDADWETTPGIEKALVGYFYTSQCYAEDMAEGVIALSVDQGHYVVIQRSPGRDCGIELNPPKSWYKVQLDLFFDGVPVAFVINGKWFEPKPALK